MGNFLNKKIGVILKLATVTALIMTGAISYSLKPGDPVQESIKPIMDYQGIQGTVSIHISVPDVIKSNIYDPPLAGIQNVSFGKLYWSEDSSSYSIGSNTLSKVRVGEKLKLKAESDLGKAIIQKGLFSRIWQGSADYVLDVWVVDAFRSSKGLTVSNEMFLTSIWRLTRAKDNKVVICAFVRGHGKWNGSLEKAFLDMIQNGLLILSDKSMPLTAVEIAGDWPSMGAVIPEGYSRLKENWTRLQKGMTEENVRLLIPSLPNRTGCINRYFSDQQWRSPLVIKHFENGKNRYIAEPSGEWHELNINNLDKNLQVDPPSGWNTKIVVVSYLAAVMNFHKDSKGNLLDVTLDMPYVVEIISVKKETFEPLYPFYNMTFVNGVLDHWEMKN